MKRRANRGVSNPADATDDISFPRLISFWGQTEESTYCAGFGNSRTGIPLNPGQSFGIKIDFRTRRFAILDLDLNEGLMNGETEAGETY